MITYNSRKEAKEAGFHCEREQCISVSSGAVVSIASSGRYADITQPDGTILLTAETGFAGRDKKIQVADQTWSERNRAFLVNLVTGAPIRVLKARKTTKRVVYDALDVLYQVKGVEERVIDGYKRIIFRLEVL